MTIADRVGIAIVDLKVPQSQHVSAKDRLDIRVRCWAGEGPAAIPLHCGSLSTRTRDDVAIALRTDFRPFAVAHRASDWAKTIVEAAYASGEDPGRPLSGRLIALKLRERRFWAANSKAAVGQCAWQSDQVGGPARRQAKPAGRRR